MSQGADQSRFGLFDMVLVKDNHLLARNGLARLSAAIERVRRERPDLKIEVEAIISIKSGAFGNRGRRGDLLDNMKATAMRKRSRLAKER